MKLTSEVFGKYPEVRIGVIVTNSVENGKPDEEIESLLRNAKDSVKRNFDADSISDHPSISSWRKIYSSFGSKPSDYRSSVEALVRSVLKGRDIPHINKTVDLYNFISLIFVIPAGGVDLDKIEGNI
ncbi:MAG: hypothetical protein HY368_01920, partial [Candidatus Aenigmarchaeota archaeon]|nr:hypothetical protein [Candidatus Aenigmarchaeota archaeon]